jgi:oxygen-independent coproporphyrinogen III oxidase
MTARQLSVVPMRRLASAPLSDVEILARIDERLPRYTSYPTAPHFSPVIGADTYASWLDSLDAKSPVSLYLHVPFCEQLCHYCGCHTTVAHKPDRIAHYAQLLLREVDLVADAIGRRQTVSHVHWGGGTPTALAADDFAAIAGSIGKRFHVDKDAEIAVEIDPRHVDRGHIDAFAAAGVNRASLGVQDFNPEVQHAIGRIQSLEQTARAVQRLRRIGVERISFDLMYGLPHQTELSVASSVATALTLQPSRISLFGYAHVPWMKKHQELIPADALPGPLERLRQARAAEAQLARAGYVAIGLDHFAQADDPLAIAQSTGRLHRNFQGYTTDEAPALIGLGASSIGFLSQGYVQNSPNLKLYREAIERGHLATARGFALSDDDRLRRRIIERLMCDLTVDLADMIPNARTAFAPELRNLADLTADGLVVVEGTTIVVPHPMRPFVRKIAAVFDTYLQRSEMRHSRAV